MRRRYYGNAPSIPREGLPPGKQVQQEQRLAPLDKAARAELIQRRGFGGTPSSTGASFSKASLHPQSFGPTPPFDPTTAHPSTSRATFNGYWWTSYWPTIHEPSYPAAHVVPFGKQRERINAIEASLLDADYGAKQLERWHANIARKAARRQAIHSAVLTFEEMLQRRKAERVRGGGNLRKPLQVQAVSLDTPATFL